MKNLTDRVFEVFEEVVSSRIEILIFETAINEIRSRNIKKLEESQRLTKKLEEEGYNEKTTQEEKELFFMMLLINEAFDYENANHVVDSYTHKILEDLTQISPKTKKRLEVVHEIIKKTQNVEGNELFTKILTLLKD